MNKCLMVQRCGGLFSWCFSALCVLCLVGARWGWLEMFSSFSSVVPHLIFNSDTASSFLSVHQSRSGSCIGFLQDLLNGFPRFLFF